MRRMKDSCRVLTLIALSFAPWGQSHKADGSDTKSEARVHPSPEMEHLLNAFVGKWTVRETFEVSPRVKKLQKRSWRAKVQARRPS
jgi:hypothetical protein